jgi:predicted nucleotidyltransferase
MDRRAAISKLKAHEAELKLLGVQTLFLFGSTLHGTARDNSDVDLFFDYERGQLGLLKLMDVQDRVSRILGLTADITTRDSLHRVLRAGIEASALRVFKEMVRNSPEPYLADMVEAIARVRIARGVRRSRLLKPIGKNNGS